LGRDGADEEMQTQAAYDIAVASTPSTPGKPRYSKGGLDRV
jgi:hypothetical protein